MKYTYPAECVSRQKTTFLYLFVNDGKTQKAIMIGTVMSIDV